MDDERMIAARVVSRLSAGPDLDRLVGKILFDMETEECPLAECGFHVVGSYHHDSGVSSGPLCMSPLPGFSTDWKEFRVVLEILSKFPGLEIVRDCGRWACNINESDETGRWYRLVSVAGAGGMQEAVCRAALMVRINPQTLPLEFRATVVSEPVRRGKSKRKPKRRSK